MNGGKGEVSTGQIILEKPDFLTRKDREDHEAKKKGPKNPNSGASFPIKVLESDKCCYF